MKKLTLDEARAEIAKRDLWVERQNHGFKSYWADDDGDYELELTGYQAVGAAGDYYDIPNR